MQLGEFLPLSHDGSLRGRSRAPSPIEHALQALKVLSKVLHAIRE
jgi:hypothetical protein